VFDLAGLLQKQDATAMGSPEANKEVRSRLAELGDNGSAPRHVLHYAYPLDGTDLASRPAMIDELTRRGLKVSDAAAKDGLVMEHHRAVMADDFDTFTGLLSAYFAERGWEYDGWECAVATS
jgi:hypothetical protein